ncbi:hypothetical protein OPV22_026543 [Ensete ventricosum]|uniref:Uncharacterized protein n=1 Tax=Ensete ventricosum TaxID=4639 RepID=A0AAV8P925_ENSVE|nr:hypothetical protein OPV22_026543 [Ensete ventricosum]RWW06145.1 hypothetical protein GW17_00030542 [Ensete ventricosum]
MPFLPPPKPSTQPKRVTEGGGGSAEERCTAHALPEAVAKYHEHAGGRKQCCSAMVQEVAAPVAVVRRFDKPQAYKRFVRAAASWSAGWARSGRYVSCRDCRRQPARSGSTSWTTSTHVLSFRAVGGEHRLANYRSVTTIHAAPEPVGHAVVVESYVVDVPPGNTREDTRDFVDTIVRCNLQSLARTAEAL